MSGFISHIIARHANPELIVHPRLPGKFETGYIRENIHPEGSPGTNMNFDQAIEKKGVSISAFTQNEQPDLTNNTGSKSRSYGQENIGEKDYDRPVDKIATVRSDNSTDINRDTSDPVEPLEIKSSRKNIFSDSAIPEKPGNRSETDPFEKENRVELTSPFEKDHTLSAQPSKSGSNVNTRPEPGEVRKGYLNSDESMNYDDRNGMQKNINSHFSGFSDVNRQEAIHSVIKVSIGRIEVRAVTDPNPVKGNQAQSQKPKMSLDDYLKKRNKAE